MSYKYELHCHTGKVSLCARVAPKDLVKIYEKNGYSGIVLTDHYSPMTFYKNMLAPQRYTEDYLAAYRELKSYCGNAFTVLLGLELRHYCTVNDYLIYGVEEAWLREQKNMLWWGEKKMSREVHKAGYLVYQAHPFRKYITRCNPELLDGIEIYNGHTDPLRNQRAWDEAKKYRKPMITGSDFHKDTDSTFGGIATELPIYNNADLLRVLKDGSYKMLMPTRI